MDQNRRYPPRPDQRPYDRDFHERDTPPDPPHRDRMASAHDVNELRSAVEDLREEITGSHFVPIPPDSSGQPAQRPTSSPPYLRAVQKFWWGLTLKGLGLIGTVVVTVLVTSAVKDCQHAAEREIIERNAAPSVKP